MSQSNRKRALVTGSSRGIGRAIAISLACIIFIMFGINAAAGSLMTVVSVGMSIFMMLLEVLVCFIQALVFTMLSAVFISLAHVHGHAKD